MNYMVNLEKLSNAMSLHGLELDKFCVKYKINKKFMQELLNGNIPDIPLNEVVNLLNALDLKFSDLFIKK